MAKGVKRTAIDIKYCQKCGSTFARNVRYSDTQWASANWCSRKCSAWNLGLTKADDPRLAATSERMRVIATGRPGWSKGLTKETHPSLAIVARKVSETQKGRPCTDQQRAALELGRSWGKGRTKENCPKIAARSANLSKVLTGRTNPEQSARLKALFAAHPEKHPNAIVARKTKGKGYTYIEQILSDLLKETGVEFAFNVRVGTKWPDFSIASHSLIFEADGEHWHQDVAKDAARDMYLQSLGWTVVHFTGKELVNETQKCRAIIAAALENASGTRIVRTGHSAVC